jgi:predicted enzyme related to lactoylglutathione lyase
MVEVVQIFVTTPSLDESRPFYEDVLQLEVGRVRDTSVEYDTDGVRLKVQEDFDDDTLDEYGMRVPPEPPARGDGAVFALQVEDVEETVERVSEEEGEVVQEPRSVPWADRIAIVRSPAGYVFESGKITAVNAILFGTLFLIVPSIGGGSVVYAYLGIGLLVLGPMIYATSTR